MIYLKTKIWRAKKVQVIDKNKDYYDHCQFEFGPVDKTVTYDRRGSKILSEDEFFKYCIDRRIVNQNFYTHRYILLEVGCVQYILGFDNIKVNWIDRATDNYTISSDTFIRYSFNEGVHLCKAPVTLAHAVKKWKYDGKKYMSFLRSIQSPLDIQAVICNSEYAFENPILKNTQIPSIIPARDFYNALDNYFRSLYNDKTVEILNSDVDKAINHGFDKKISFRHPVK